MSADTDKAAVVPAVPSDAVRLNKKDLNKLLNDFAKACAFGDDVLARMAASKAIHDHFDAAFAALSQTTQPQAGAIAYNRAREMADEVMTELETTSHGWDESDIDRISGSLLPRVYDCLNLLAMAAPCRKEEPATPPAATPAAPGEVTELAAMLARYIEHYDAKPSITYIRLTRDEADRLRAALAQPAPVAAQPVFFASAEQASVLQDWPGDCEAGVYLPLRKTAAGKFTMPLYAAPVAAPEAFLRQMASLPGTVIRSSRDLDPASITGARASSKWLSLRDGLGFAIMAEHARQATEDEPCAALVTAPAPASEAVADAQIEAAAKVIAECMDYPWAHMPEQGRNNMRQHARAVAAALQTAPPQAAGKDGAQ